MTDTVIKGTGNSRSIKAAPSIPATWDEFRAQLISSGIPIDLGALNDAGLTTHGTDLNKSTLLTNALCTALGLATTATPTQAMDKLRQLTATAQSTADGRARTVTGSYTGTKTDNNSISTKTLSFGFYAQLVIIYPNYGRWWGLAIRGTQLASAEISSAVGSVQTTYMSNLHSTTWTSAGITWKDQSIASLDKVGTTYYYIAIG